VEHEILIVYYKGGTSCSLNYLFLFHMISVLMCLLTKKCEETFKIVAFIDILLEFNYFMVSVKKNQKSAFKKLRTVSQDFNIVVFRCKVSVYVHYVSTLKFV